MLSSKEMKDFFSKNFSTHVFPSGTRNLLVPLFILFNNIIFKQKHICKKVQKTLAKKQKKYYNNKELDLYKFMK